MAGAEELADQQNKLDEALGKFLGAVSEAGGGPWEGRGDITVESLIEWGGDQDDRIRELKELIAGKQGELVRLAEVEEEEETPLRSRGITPAAAAPQEAAIHGPGQQEAAGYQRE